MLEYFTPRDLKVVLSLIATKYYKYEVEQLEVANENFELRAGKLYARGTNNCGQLGLGDKKDRQTFTRVPLEISVSGIKTKGPSSTFRFADGTVRQNGLCS